MRGLLSLREKTCLPRKKIGATGAEGARRSSSGEEGEAALRKKTGGRIGGGSASPAKKDP